MSNGDGDPIGGAAATAILAGTALTMVGALIVGLTLDFGSGDGGSETLALLTLAAVVVDLTLLGEEDARAGNVAGAVVADLASMVVVGAAAWAGMKSTRAAA